MAYACLTVLGWALILVAALLVMLVLAQHLRADELAMPREHLIGAAIALGLGCVCRWLALRFV